jgi:hypothetical protein
MPPKKERTNLEETGKELRYALSQQVEWVLLLL